MDDKLNDVLELIKQRLDDSSIGQEEYEFLQIIYDKLFDII